MVFKLSRTLKSVIILCYLLTMWFVCSPGSEASLEKSVTGLQGGSHLGESLHGQREKISSIEDFMERPIDRLANLIGRNHERPQIQHVIDQVEMNRNSSLNGAPQPRGAVIWDWV